MLENGWESYGGEDFLFSFLGARKVEGDPPGPLFQI